MQYIYIGYTYRLLDTLPFYLHYEPFIVRVIYFIELDLVSYNEYKLSLVFVRIIMCNPTYV